MSEELDIHVPQEALEAADLSVPGDFEDEIAAGDMVDYLTEYHRATTGLRAARQNEDGPRAEAYAKTVAFCRNAVALLQYKHPGAKAIADVIMRAKAEQTRRQRERILKDKE